MTNLVSGSSYPTANLYFMEVWKIECWLRANETSEDEIIVQMVETMRLKFDKYWEEYSDILSIAAVLDPRLKFAALEVVSLSKCPCCDACLLVMIDLNWKCFVSDKLV